MRSLQLCLRIVAVNFKSRMEYRYSFFMRYVVQVFSRVFELLTLWVMLDRFRQIRGWAYHEVVLLYALNLLSYGLASLFIPPVGQLERLIERGTFDSLLTCPLNPLLHLIARSLSPVFFGHLALGAVLIAVSLSRAGMAWTPLRIAWLIGIVGGAAMIQASIMTIAGTTSFWFVRSRALVLTAIFGVRNFVNYPLTIYERWIQVLLTFVVPYAFVSFFPAQSLLNRGGEAVFHPALQYGTPVVGGAMALLAYWFWNVGLDHYQGTGH